MPPIKGLTLWEIYVEYNEIVIYFVKIKWLFKSFSILVRKGKHKGEREREPIVLSICEHICENAVKVQLYKEYIKNLNIDSEDPLPPAYNKNTTDEDKNHN